MPLIPMVIDPPSSAQGGLRQAGTQKSDILYHCERKEHLCR